MNAHSKETIREAVTKHYGTFARKQLEAGGAEGAAESAAESAAGKAGKAAACCGPDTGAATGTQVHQAEAACCGPDTDAATAQAWADRLYDDKDLGDIDGAIADLTLGCGNPIAIAELNPGETVLDLGSGAGLDCFLASRQVGAGGKVIGVDMTGSMLELAARNLEKVGARNVEFRRGYLEDLPVASDAVDVIISNCVINLSFDKGAVLSETFRVLRPGGRVRVSDIVWLREPTAGEQSDLASWAGCVAGALTVADFTNKLEEAGFTGIEITPATPENPQGFSSASISARKPW